MSTPLSHAELTARYTIRGYKAHNTREGVAYTCKLYEHGKPVAHIEDSGTGGGASVHFMCADPLNPRQRQATHEARQRFGDTARRLPVHLTILGREPADHEDLIEYLVSVHENNRVARKYTLLRVAAAREPGRWEHYRLKGHLGPQELRQEVQRHAKLRGAQVWTAAHGWQDIP